MFSQELREAMHEPGCPVCRVADRALDRYWRWFVLENYYSAPTLVQLAQGFFCRTHSRQLSRRIDARLSGTIEYLARSDLHRLQDSSPPARSWYGWLRALWYRLRGRPVPPPWLERLQRKGRCPACALEDSSADFVLHTFVTMLLREEEGAWEDYRASDGLCREHWLRLAGALDDPWRERLRQDLTERLQVLGERIQLYFHKTDYRFRHEPRGDEQHAWLDGLAFFGGEVRRDGHGVDTLGVGAQPPRQAAE